MNYIQKCAKKYAKGFTLVELLVVIAIIGILAAIILTNLSQARTSGEDAKVEGQLSQIRNAAESYYDSNTDSYSLAGDCNSGMFADTFSGMAQLVATSSYPANTQVLCTASSTTYAVTANLSASSTWWCVDSTGASKQEADSNFADDTVCE